MLYKVRIKRKIHYNQGDFQLSIRLVRGLTRLVLCFPSFSFFFFNQGTSYYKQLMCDFGATD